MTPSESTGTRAATGPIAGGTTPAEGIAAAARWRLMSALLERPHAGWLDELDVLAREVRDADLRAAVAAARRASEGAYLRLLGPGGAVPAREVAYRGFADPGAVLADVARYYAAFGYRPRTEDPLDHVAVEAGFVGYLCLKEALARELGDDAAAVVTAAACAGFLRDHLAATAAGLARRLAACGDSYLSCAAAALALRAPQGDQARVEEETRDPDGESAGPCGGCHIT